MEYYTTHFTSHFIQAIGAVASSCSESRSGEGRLGQSGFWPQMEASDNEHIKLYLDRLSRSRQLCTRFYMTFFVYDRSGHESVPG